jgi:colicin import membrane protein
MKEEVRKLAEERKAEMNAKRDQQYRENAEKAAPFLTLRREQLREVRQAEEQARLESERQAALAREATEAARLAAAEEKEKARLARAEAKVKAKEDAEAADARAEAERLRAEMKRKREEYIEQLKKEALEAHYAELKAREDIPKHPRWRQLTKQAQKFLEGSYEPRTDILKRMDEPSFLEETERAARGP